MADLQPTYSDANSTQSAADAYINTAFQNSTQSTADTYVNTAFQNSTQSAADAYVNTAFQNASDAATGNGTMGDSGASNGAMGDGMMSDGGANDSTMSDSATGNDGGLNLPSLNQMLSQQLAPSSPQKKKAPYEKNMKQVVDGYIVHPSGEELARPVEFPRSNKAVLIAFAVVAAIIGVLIFSQYVSSVVNSSSRKQADIQTYLARESPLNLPVLADKVYYDNEDLLISLEDGEDATILDVSDGDDDFDVVKLPADMDSSVGESLYDRGIGKLSAVEAAQLLNGFWRLDVDRADGYTIRVRYVDFDSGDVSTALTQCLVNQGIDGETATDEGEDDSGNTYKTGQIDIDDSTYQWRASAIALDKVYDIGLPSNAIYVGFRLTWIS